MKTLKYAWRFLMRSKSYTIINLLGLAFSLACSIILMRYIHRELTVDTHCIDREHVYAICTNTEGNRGLSGLKQYNYDTISIDNRFVEAMTNLYSIGKGLCHFRYQPYSGTLPRYRQCIFPVISLSYSARKAISHNTSVGIINRKIRP